MGTDRGDDRGASRGASRGAAEEAEFAAMSFEQLVDALEALTTRMAAGDIGIEEVADLYERAGRLHDLAAARLEGVRQRIEGLVAEGDAGERPGDGAGDPPGDLPG